jgi:hypothetical protein
MNYDQEIKDPLNKWNLILIYYVMDFLKFQKLKLFKNTF